MSTQDQVLEALKSEDAQATINRIAEATGLSYSKVYRSFRTLADEGVIEEVGTTGTGASLFVLSEDTDEIQDEEAAAEPEEKAVVLESPRRRSTDGLHPLIPPLPLGVHLKVMGVSLKDDDGPQVIIDLVATEGDPSQHVRAVLLEG